MTRKLVLWAELDPNITPITCHKSKTKVREPMPLAEVHATAVRASKDKK
jgi:hypothetical protein